ncbi:MAG: dihydrolipoamide acetyltransferase family protein [Breznakibacter sp.]
MATVVIMPKQGQSVESCIITEFNKNKGDTVAKGDILFAYETDKASFEEVSTVEGTVLELFFGTGDEVPVLTNVMVIGLSGESVEEFRPGGAASVQLPATGDKPEAAVSPALVVAAPKPEIGKGEEGAGVSPRARQLAEKEGIAVQLLAGSGPKGRVIERDVQAAVAERPKMTPLAKQVASIENIVPATTGSGLAGLVTSKDLVAENPVYGTDSEVKPLTNIRKLIAKAMHASLQNSAQLTHHLGADARRLMELRKKIKAAVDKGYPTNITLNDMVCFAIIKALKKFPQVNSHFLGDSMRLFSKVHLGLAVDTDRGLMVPVVKNADDLSVPGLANQLKEMANACRKGNISPELLASDAASFTVSNLGNYGVEMFTPVINLPQSAILGVNAIVPRPKDLGDGVYGFVPYMGLSLTYDHRALDGGEATRFVKQVAVEIENLEFEI